MEDINITKKDLRDFTDSINCMLQDVFYKMEIMFHSFLERQNEIYERKMHDIIKMQKTYDLRNHELATQIAEIMQVHEKERKETLEKALDVIIHQNEASLERRHDILQCFVQDLRHSVMKDFEYGLGKVLDILEKNHSTKTEINN